MVLACVVLAGASCGGSDGDDGADDPDPPTTTAPETTTTLTQEEQDEEALRQLAQDWFEAAPGIYSGSDEISLADEFVIDPYREQVADDVERRRADGTTIEVNDASSNEVLGVEVTGDEATIRQCIVDADILVDADGDVVDDSVVTLTIESSARRTPDGWRFFEREAIDQVEGEASCDA